MTTSARAISDQNADQLLTASQAAQLLAVHVSTIRRWIRQGKLPAYRVGDKGIRVRRADVHLLINPLADHWGSNRSVQIREVAGIAPRRLTAEEQQKALDAVEGARRLQTEMLEKRGGRHFPDSTMLIRKMREERSRELTRAIDE
jgi:excisionase family DNA binding protein